MDAAPVDVNEQYELERAHFYEYREMNGIWVQLTEEQIEHFNRLQVIHSYRQVYSSTNDFTLAEKICQGRPDVCLPEDNRVEINIYDKESYEPGKLRMI